jgi:hypothetical protein
VLDDAAIAAALAEVASAFDHLAPGLYRAVIQAEGLSFRVLVRQSPGLVRLEVSPLFDSRQTPEGQAALHRELLIRNRTLVEARFALGDDDEPLLEAVLDEAAPPSALIGAIDALGAAIDGHVRELQGRYAR